MPSDEKESITKKITDFTVFKTKHLDTPSSSEKRPISATSPGDMEIKLKKANIEGRRNMYNKDEMSDQTNQQTAGLKDLLTPLIEEV